MNKLLRGTLALNQVESDPLIILINGILFRFAVRSLATTSISALFRTGSLIKSDTLCGERRTVVGKYKCIRFNGILTMDR